jgi:hypothetical protein
VCVADGAEPAHAGGVGGRGGVEHGERVSERGRVGVEVGGEGGGAGGRGALGEQRELERVVVRRPAGERAAVQVVTAGERV